MKNVPSIDHKYLIQSYIFTTARYNYSIYEKRILYRLVEYAQMELQGMKIKDNMNRIKHNLNDVSISMPIASILVTTEKCDVNKHYQKAKDACRALGKKYLEWEDLEKGEYWGDNILYNIHIVKGEGVMHFNVVNWVWDAILDFSKGFRKYDMAIAMKLHSQYSMRFFEIMSGQSKPLEITVEELRRMFFLKEGQYKLTADLQKRILAPAQQELDMTSPYSFEFVPNFEKNKIVSYTFYPVFIAANQDEKLLEAEQMAKVTAKLQLDQRIYDYLRYSFGFTLEEINKNKKTFIEAQKKIVNYIDFLSSIRKNAMTANDMKAYVVGATKRVLLSAESVKNAKREASVYASTNDVLKDRTRQLILNFSPK